MKVFVTKYALTKGIIENIAEVVGETKTMVKVYVAPSISYYYHKPYWHETLEAAKKHAEQMRSKKIETLKKQIKKIENIKF